MRKRHIILKLIIFILSAVWLAFNINAFVQHRNWISTTADITFVGLPNGAVFGTYVDKNNQTHTDVFLYTDYFHQRNTNVDGLIGKEVNIVYDPVTGEVAKNNNTRYLISLLVFLLSSFFLYRAIKAIKVIDKYLKSCEYADIKYNGMQEYEKGHPFVFFYTDSFNYDYDLSTKEAIVIFKDLMNLINEKKLLVKCSALYLILNFSANRDECDLLLSNCYDGEIDSGNVSYLTVSDLDDISVISEISEELKYIRVKNTESAEKIFSLHFSNIKEMHFSDCRYSNGENFPSDSDLRKLKEKQPGCKIKAFHFCT